MVRTKPERSRRMSAAAPGETGVPHVERPPDHDRVQECRRLVQRCRIYPAAGATGRGDARPSEENPHRPARWSGADVLSASRSSRSSASGQARVTGRPTFRRTRRFARAPGARPGGSTRRAPCRSRYACTATSTVLCIDRCSASASSLSRCSTSGFRFRVKAIPELYNSPVGWSTTLGVTSPPHWVVQDDGGEDRSDRGGRTVRISRSSRSTRPTPTPDPSAARKPRSTSRRAWQGNGAPQVHPPSSASR